MKRKQLGPRFYVLPAPESAGGIFIEANLGPSISVVFLNDMAVTALDVGMRFGLGYEFPSALGKGVRLAGWFYSQRASDFGRIHSLMITAGSPSKVER